MIEMVRGVPAAGHLTPRGFWHPGASDGCPKCSSGDDVLGYAEVARLARVEQSTLRKYRADGRLPEPDAPCAPDRPRWRRSTIERWLAERPGRPGRPRQAP